MKFLPPILAFTLASCASKPDKETAESRETTEPETIIIGRIASVSKAGQFVLIQKYGPAPLVIGELYQSRGLDDRSASLRPSGERIRDFYAADLLNGRVKKGDAVIAYAKPLKEKEEDAPPEDLPATEADSQVDEAPESEIQGELESPPTAMD